MKTAVSIPDPLFKEAEAAAKELGLSRSRLFQTALKQFLEARRDAAITASLNRSIEKHGDPSDDEEAWLAHNLETLRQVEWKE